MALKNGNFVSMNGKGSEEWRYFVAMKEEELDYPFPNQYDDEFATGGYLDIVPGLFSLETFKLITPYLDIEGRYPTGICEDYDGNWMLRRCLKSDIDGTEYIAEGTVSPEGEILKPIQIHPYKYKPNTVYPLNGSWDDVKRIVSRGTWDGFSSFNRMEACYVNLIVPLSFFSEELQEEWGPTYGNLSSRSFYTGVGFSPEGIFLSCIHDYIMHYDENGKFDMDTYGFLRADLATDGTIVEQLTSGY